MPVWDLEGRVLDNTSLQLAVLVMGSCILQLFPTGYPRTAAEAAMEKAYHENISVPWDREGSFTRYLLVDGNYNGKSRFHLFDPWHCLHLGVGKSWAASGIMLLQKYVAESNVDKRIAVMCSEYRQFCKRAKIPPILNKFDIHSLGGPGNVERNGHWSKAAVTSNLMLFLEDYMERNAETVLRDRDLQVFVS